MTSEVNVPLTSGGGRVIMRTPRLAFRLLSAALCLVLPACGPSERVEPSDVAAVSDAVALEARPFQLQDVRLLDGRFQRAMQLDQEYLLSLDQDRLLHTFRVNAGLASSADPLGGWEAPDVELRGHTTGHYLTASALMFASTGDERFKRRAETMVSGLAEVQAALDARGFNAGYLSAFPEELFDRVERSERVWAPYYTIHKIMNGLLDVRTLTGSLEALEVLIRMADWVEGRVDRLSEGQQQAALETEFGGMNDLFANLYAVTGDPDHLDLARAFEHRAVLDPLARGEDPLDGLHGNTQIPKVIGAARQYELTGEQRYRDIATFFWSRVANHRSYVIGGNTYDERFFPVEDFSQQLGTVSAETCNTYNMLKLTRHLFAWSPSTETMDFYERGLFNHILGSQDPDTGMAMYYCPLRPGSFKTFATPGDSFWCCVGTGLENHAKYTDTIYFHDDESLYVNLFIASRLTWASKGLVVTQDTSFPDEDTMRLTVQAENPVTLALKIRYPGWATGGMDLTVNGEPQPVDAMPGTYVTLQREWRSDDTVVVRLPMSLHAEAMPDDPATVALLYGPIVLAGDLGTTGLDRAERYGRSAPRLTRMPPVDIVGLVGDMPTVLAGIEPVAGEPLRFRTTGIGQPRDVELGPFYRMFDTRYTVYWNRYTEAEWLQRVSDVAATEARRLAIGEQTVDAVDLNEPESEVQHGFRGESTSVEGEFESLPSRQAVGGWFSYDLQVDPEAPMTLMCTYRGSGGLLHSFDILVDGERVAIETLEYHPSEFLDREYDLPVSLTRGKTRVTVRFEAREGGVAGSLFDARMVRRLGDAR